MKESIKITAIIIIFFLIQLFMVSKLSAEVIKTGEHSFYSTEEQMEYTVWDDCTKAAQVGLLKLTLDFTKDENAEIHWVKGVPNEVVEGMKAMDDCVVSKSSYKNVEVWNWLKSNGETWTIFIIYRR